MARSVTKICWMSRGDVSGCEKAAEEEAGEEAALICPTTVPVAGVRGQDVLLTPTPLLFPSQKPLTQVVPQPAIPRQRSSAAENIP